MEIGKINYLPHGASYVENGPGVNKLGFEISKEEYDRLSQFTNAELDTFLESILPDDILWGYGFYGCKLVHDEEYDLYFFEKSIGSSCD